MRRLAALFHLPAHLWALFSAIAVATAVVAVGAVSLRVDDLPQGGAAQLFGDKAWGAPWDATADSPATPALQAMASLDETLAWLVILCITICVLSLLLHAVGWMLSMWNTLTIRVALGARLRHLWALVSGRLLTAGAFGVMIGLALGGLVVRSLSAIRPELLVPPQNPLSGTLLALGLGLALLVLLAGLPLPALWLLHRRQRLAAELHGDHTTAGRRMLFWQGLLPVAQFAGLLIVTFASYVLWQELPLGDLSDEVGEANESITVVRTAPEVPTAGRAAAWRTLWGALREHRDAFALTSHGASLGLGPVVPAVVFCDACFRGAFFTPITSEPVRLIALSPESLTVIGGEIIRGRDVSDADQLGSEPIVLLNELAALRLFPGADPVGRPVRIGGGPDHTVAGLVRRALPFGPGNSDPSGIPTIFVSIFQHPPPTIELASAAGFDARDTVDGLSTRDALVVSDERQLTATLRAFGAPLQFAALLFLIVAAASTGVAGIALVAVMIQMVETRRREVAIRLACGARGRHILAWITGRSLRLAMVGVVLGISGARWIWDALLVDRSPEGVFGPLVIITGAFAIIALVSSLWPAHRAIQTEPAVLASTIRPGRPRLKS